MRSSVLQRPADEPASGRPGLAYSLWLRVTRLSRKAGDHGRSTKRRLLVLEVPANDVLQRFLAIAAPSREGLLTEPTAGAQP